MSLASTSFGRRSFLQFVAICGLGLTLDQFFRLQAPPPGAAPLAQTPAPPKSCTWLQATREAPLDRLSRSCAATMGAPPGMT